MSLSIIAAMVLLCGLLLLTSYVERCYVEIGKFMSREFQENVEVYEQQVEPRLRVSRNRVALSMSVLSQLSTAALGILMAFGLRHDAAIHAREIFYAVLLVLALVAVFNRLLPFVLFARTQGTWLTSFTPLLRLLIYAAMVITIPITFMQSVAALSREHPAEQPETQAQAVDALIEAGQEEGILQEGDRALIQSVVEFGDKTVREVMTPRPEITAVPVETTIEQLIGVLRNKPHSRVPVYEGTLDSIKGVVYAHDVLQVPDAEARSKRVRQLMKPAFFVPESRQVNGLLREMQRGKLRMAIVIDEYGSVSGVVTLEDMLEEIVGEIHDEHEPQTDVVRESETSYLVPGSMDVDRLEELFNVKPEGHEATTVAGLVSEALGRIPHPGEVVEQDELRYEVLESTGRRIERLRISARGIPQPRQMRA